MKKNINKSLIIICLISVLLTAFGVTFIYYQLFQRQVRDDLRISLELLRATGLFDDVTNVISNKDLRNDDDVLRVTWVDSNGKVLFDSDSDASKMENLLNREEIREAFERGSGEMVRESSVLNMNTYYYAVLLNNDTVLRIASDARGILSIFLTAVPLILLIALLIVAFCVSLSQFLTRQLLNPVEEMIDNIDDPDIQPAYVELKPFSEKIRKQYDEITEAAQITEEFSANVSHELKTPLTSIKGYGELIENDTSNDPKVQHFAHEIVKNASRLQNLIENTIFLSRLDRHEKLETESLDLGEMVETCCQDLRQMADGKNVTIEHNSEKAIIDGDREMVMTVIQNLISNAITYNRENGKVWVSVENREGKSILSVKDNGIGISEKDQKRVFERFYRVDKSHSKKTGGTGLGLAIVKHIAELHGAEITLESELDKGTTVSVAFNRVEQNQE